MKDDRFALVEKIGDLLVEGFHFMGLFVILGVVFWAAASESVSILKHGVPGIKDILLLFIYLELGAMVGIYFKTKKLPVRFLLYIAITALTRVLAVDAKTMSEYHMIAVTVAIMLLTLSVLLFRVGSDRFPCGESD